MLSRRAWLAMAMLVALAVLLASPVHAQNPCAGLNAVQTDSLQQETFRRSSSGSLLSPRATVVRRLATRIDSIDANCNVTPPAPRADSVAVSFDYTTTVYWPGLGTQVGSVPPSGLLCAGVVVQGMPHLGTSLAQVRVVGQDSIAFGVVTFDAIADLRRSCRASLPVGGVEWPLAPVTWTSDRVRLGDRWVAVPFAEAVIP